MGETHPVTFRDGSRAGQTIELPDDVHHFQSRCTGEYWQRFNEAPDGVLRSYLELARRTDSGSHARTEPVP